MFFFSVNSTFRFAIFSCLTELKHSTSLSAMFVYIRKPPNNPINACAPRLSPRLSLFYEVSYKQYFKAIFQKNDWCFCGKKPNLDAFHRI